MIISIDQTSPEALYLQIRAQVIAAIARGDLRPGDGLPSVRALASNLGVNLHTVNKAYAVLRDEGYLLMRGRSGAFVAEPLREASPARAALADDRLAGNLRDLALEHKAAGGGQDDFLAEAHRQAAAVYGDPGVAGPSRDIRVLGLDEQGSPLSRSERAPFPASPAPSAARS